MKRQPRTVTKEQMQIGIDEEKESRGVRTIPGIGYHETPKYEPSDLLLEDLPF